jgi:electron transfer flavoprotein-quinone oxidoreductase
MVERGATVGCKNVSGGLIYADLVAQVYPEFAASAPLERAITAHQVVMLADQAATALDFRHPCEPGSSHNAFSVLRAQFDPWMAAQAEEAGAALITGVTVDALRMEGGRVAGIIAGPDEIAADVVVVAEGTRAGLLHAAELTPRFHPHDVSLGVKEVIGLPRGVLEERFLCEPDTGMAYTLVGHTAGIEGGGFIYTNRESLSVGVVVKIDSLYEHKLQPHQVLDAFKAHPLVERLVRGGEILEYSAQTVHRGGYEMPGARYGDGYVVVGSAARLLLNNVMTLRGMDFAVASGAAAAQAILAAQGSGYAAADLAGYDALLKQSPVYADWKSFKDAFTLMENKRLFEVYPELAAQVMEGMFSPSDQPSPKMLAALRGAMAGKVGWGTLAKDGWQIAKGMVL